MKDMPERMHEAIKNEVLAAADAVQDAAAELKTAEQVLFRLRRAEYTIEKIKNELVKP